MKTNGITLYTLEMRTKLKMNMEISTMYLEIYHYRTKKLQRHNKKRPIMAVDLFHGLTVSLFIIEYNFLKCLKSLISYIQFLNPCKICLLHNQKVLMPRSFGMCKRQTLIFLPCSHNHCLFSGFKLLYFFL